MRLKYFNPKFWIITFLDWYINSYQSNNYIHISKIQDEIARRIDNALTRNNEARDKQLEEALKTERMRHKIIEDGYVAEILSMEKNISDAQEMRADAEEVYFKGMERAREIMFIAAEVKHEREEIINDLSATMGKLDRLILTSKEINDMIDKDKKVDERKLRLK